jgi:hypothetical protein
MILLSNSANGRVSSDKNFLMDALIQNSKCSLTYIHLVKYGILEIILVHIICRQYQPSVVITTVDETRFFISMKVIYHSLFAIIKRVFILCILGLYNCCQWMWTEMPGLTASFLVEGDFVQLEIKCRM